jgi:hypothetical protein
MFGLAIGMALANTRLCDEKSPPRLKDALRTEARLRLASPDHVRSTFSFFIICQQK